MGFYGESNMCMLQMELEIFNLMNINNVPNDFKKESFPL
jgi:hypothetical protein